MVLVGYVRLCIGVVSAAGTGACDVRSRVSRVGQIYVVPYCHVVCGYVADTPGEGLGCRFIGEQRRRDGIAAVLLIAEDVARAEDVGVCSRSVGAEGDPLERFVFAGPVSACANGVLPYLNRRLLGVGVFRCVVARILVDVAVVRSLQLEVGMDHVGNNGVCTRKKYCASDAFERIVKLVGIVRRKYPVGASDDAVDEGGTLGRGK